MSFQQFNGYNGQARRDDNKISVYLLAKQPVPDMVPFELRDHILPDIWHARMTAIRDLAFRFYNPIFERIWLFVASLATIVLPFALYSVIFSAIAGNVRDLRNDPNANEKIFKARAISFAVFVGTLLVFWAPMVIWKMIGARRVKALCSRWYNSDMAAKSAGSFVPLWTVESPTVFKSSCIVRVTLPPNVMPTVFHPNAYMPNWINPPADGGAPYYYPYVPGGNGLPRMSTAGTLPAYQNVPGKEKYFEDVKV